MNTILQVVQVHGTEHWYFTIFMRHQDFWKFPATRMWLDGHGEIEQRPAVIEESRRDKTWRPKELRLKERHSAGDFD